MGPYCVLRHVGAVAYELELSSSLVTHPVFHVSLLRPYDASGDAHRWLPPDPVIIERQPEFEVESILRHHGRGLQYLVHWSG